jgi:hypothetical protein
MKTIKKQTFIFDDKIFTSSDSNAMEKQTTILIYLKVLGLVMKMIRVFLKILTNG